MIRIYFSKCYKRLSKSDFVRYLNLLPAEVEKKIVRFKNWRDRHASLFGKLLLRNALYELGLDINLEELKQNSYGRPYITRAPDFNISHSGIFTVCAISSNGRIGIDIEETKPIFIGDFRHSFSKSEWEDVLMSDNTNRCFYYYWTAKEAVSKADGRGVNYPFERIKIKSNLARINKMLWHIKEVAIDDRYILQIATDSYIDSEIKLVQVSF